MWVFVEGESIPAFDDNGFVTGTDSKNSLVNDLKNYIEWAASKNVFIVLTLWNGALMRNDRYKNLFSDSAKLDSFIDNALTPLVEGLKN